MLNANPKRGAIGVAQEKVVEEEITALIGLSGPAQGMVALGFPQKTAVAKVSRLLDEKGDVTGKNV